MLQLPLLLLLLLLLQSYGGLVSAVGQIWTRSSTQQYMLSAKPQVTSQSKHQEKVVFSALMQHSTQLGIECVSVAAA
jgi:hypothetical protein